MGGSAASAVAGAVAADARPRHQASRSEPLLEAALEAEAVVAGRHADNVAPSLLGGAVLVVEPGSAAFRPGACPPEASPSSSSRRPTGSRRPRARAVLPAEVTRERRDRAGRAPGRAGPGPRARRPRPDPRSPCATASPSRRGRRSIPAIREARAAALAAGALGVVVSGAGPTVVAIVPGTGSRAVGEALLRGYRSVGIDAVAHEAQVDEVGARVESQG